jgi:hypothetical protein
MALNTRRNRGSAIHPFSPWRGIYPTGDGTIDQGDRQEAAYAYAGINAGTVSPGEPGGMAHTIFRFDWVWHLYEPNG